MIKLKALYSGKTIKNGVIYQGQFYNGFANVNDKFLPVIYVDVLVNGKLLSTYCWNVNDFNNKWLIL